MEQIGSTATSVGDLATALKDRDPSVEPIISSPYEEPKVHWGLDAAGRAMAGNIQEGRRESMRLAPVPEDKLGQRTLPLAEEQVERNDIVNEIRKKVRSWRDADYPYAKPITRKLLCWWNREVVPGDSMFRRPFFAQNEAVETLIWAMEARRDRDFVESKVLSRSRDLNDGLTRLCAKMATGTGKTAVMGMLIAWQHLAGHAHEFLVIAPSITVRDRLRALLPTQHRNVYEDLCLIPDDLADHMRSASVTVVNWHNLVPQSVTDPDAAKLTGRVEQESDRHLASRVLGARPNQRVCVINDEAHHCYRPRRESKGQARKDDDEAKLWFKGIQSLRAAGHIPDDAHIYDFSATPIWNDSVSKAKPDLFEWVVSDFSLLDAIESGLVKLPRAPVDDTFERKSAEDGTKWRRLYHSVSAKQRKLHHHFASGATALPAPMDSAVDAVYRSWQQRRLEWIEQDPESPGPVMIFVASDVAGATALYDWIAGRPESGPAGGAQLPDLANYDQHGHPISPPRTLLMHSKIDAADGGAAPGSLKTHIDRLADTLPSLADVDRPTRKQKTEALREMLNTVGKQGQPGAQVRCVVSVSMLTEGWDAQNVTHIVGYRAFSTQLLCEQVTGRALRRRSYELHGSSETYEPEYAEVVGIPFEFMPGGSAKPPRPPPQSVLVETLLDRGESRIWWPNINGYRVRRPSVRFSLDPDLVTSWRYDRDASADVIAEFAPVVGEAELVEVPAVADKRKRLRLAELVTNKISQGALLTDQSPDGTVGKMSLFRCAYAAATDWSRHPLIHGEWSKTRFGGSDHVTAAESVIHACSELRCDGNAFAAVLGHPPELSTAGVRFTTTLKNPEPVAGLERTELSHAACHSHLEVAIAEALSRHPRVVRWVRNYRLVGRGGQATWTIPYYFDRAWRAYEPDFVAVLDDGSGLIVEGKGIVDDKAVTARRGLPRWGQCAFEAHSNGSTPNSPSVWRETTIGMEDDPSESITIGASSVPLHEMEQA